MANKSKQRYIDTKFWSDGFITELDPLERYLFIYLLTNEHTNICGIYELPLRVMAFESGIDKEMLPKMLSRFAEKAGKIEYINGWVCIRNFIKHQASENVKIKTGIIEKLKEVPKEIIDTLIGLKYPIDTLLIGYTYPSNNTNTDKDTNTDTNKDIVSGDKSPTPKENATEFFKEVELLKTGKKNEAERLVKQIDALMEKYSVPYEPLFREIVKFANYWTELNSTGTKQRWQKQETFEIGRRLITWFGNIKQFQGQNNNNGPKLIKIK